MSTYQASKAVSGIAGTAVSIHRFVTLASDGEYDHTGAVGRPDGVSGEDVAIAGVFPVNIPNGSIVKVEAGGVVAVGDKVASDAVGRAVTDANPGVAGYWGGIAHTAAAALGDIIEVLFTVDQDQVA